MSLLKMARIGHPALREAAKELTREELLSPRWQGFIDDLVETMRDADGGGLAATQVHVPARLYVVEGRPGNPRYPYKPVIPLTVVVNPRIQPIGEETFESYEGCLSVP
ncbi:peptide deformylase, partial [Planctomycetota bacterium]